MFGEAAMVQIMFGTWGGLSKHKRLANGSNFNVVIEDNF